MSTKTITLNNSLDTVSIGYITMGDTLVVNVGTGFDKATHYKLRIIDSFGLEVWLPSESDYTTQTQFTYTFEDRANSSYLNAWGSGFVVSLRAYEERVTKWDTWYSSVGAGTASGVLQIDVSKYRPTMSFSNVIATNTYNGLALAGISKLQATLSTGHLNSSDKASLNEPKLLVYSDSFESYRPVTKDDTTIVSTNELPTSTDKYYAWFKGYVQDSRYVYQDGTKGLMPWTMDIPRTPTYVESSKVLVYPYALPTYDPNYTYVNRCDASGKADGSGGYARIHISYDISIIDGTNTLNDIVSTLNSTSLTPINENYKTDGYVDYICEIASNTEGDVSCTISDKTGMSTTFTLRIPAASLPLSLFDDGTNRGTAFGQMATKVGNWFYGNVVMVRNNIPYIFDIDSETQELVARRLFGDTGIRNLYCTFHINTSSGTSLYPSEFTNGVQIYTTNNPAKEQDAYVYYTSKYDSKTSDDVTVLAGTVLYIKGFALSQRGLSYQMFINGTLAVKDNVVQTTDYELSKLTWTLDGVSYIIWAVRVANQPLDICFSCGEFGTSQYWNDLRLKFTIVSQNSNYYSFWDDDNLNHSTNESLILYSLQESTPLKLFQESTDKSLDYWLVGSTEYYTESLEVTLTQTQTVTAVYKSKISVLNVVVTFNYVSQSGLSALFSVTNLDTGETLIDVSWSTSAPTIKSIKVNENTNLRFYYYTYDNDYPSLVIDDTYYKGSNYTITKDVQVTSTMSVSVS